jgi:hypothetical protein
MAGKSTCLVCYSQRFIGFIYGPVAHIPPAADFTRFIAVPLAAATGIWLWQKPRLLRWARQQSANKVFTEGTEGNGGP